MILVSFPVLCTTADLQEPALQLSSWDLSKLLLISQKFLQLTGMGSNHGTSEKISKLRHNKPIVLPPLLSGGRHDLCP